MDQPRQEPQKARRDMSQIQNAVDAAMMNPNGLEVAEAAAHDAMVARRCREEKEWRAQRCCGQFLKAAEYSQMNRSVDRIMETTPEAQAYYAIRDAARKIRLANLAAGGAA